MKVEHFDEHLALEAGGCLAGFDLAYETYGRLSPRRDNAILVCHGLTGDAHAAGVRPSDNRIGWWDAVIGPGRMLDTDRYFVVATNALGGCGGSTGPASVDPASGKPYALRFPIVTVSDMVRAQQLLLTRLGIVRLHAAIGGCMGGFQVLEFARRFPQALARGIVISATHATSAHSRALWHTLRSAITADPNWRGGDYHGHAPPLAGVGLSMKIAMLIWMDRAEFAQRFAGDNAQDIAYDMAPQFGVEKFLGDIQSSASARFDANALLYLTRAMDYFDLMRGHDTLAQALAPIGARMLFVSYKQDWRYPSCEMERMRQAMLANGRAAEHVVLESRFGHGAFVYDPASLVPHVRAFIDQPNLVEALLA